jgi:hypothetical protein
MITPFECRLHWAGAVFVKHIANVNRAKLPMSDFTRCSLSLIPQTIVLGSLDPKERWCSAAAGVIPTVVDQPHIGPTPSAVTGGYVGRPALEGSMDSHWLTN